MSLLLEALKKAELAKQGRKPADDDETSGALQFEPAPPISVSAAQPKAQPFITRGELPDISQPLEIFSEDFPSASAKRAADETSIAPIVAAPMAVEPMTIEPLAAAPMAVAPPAPLPPPYRPARAKEPEVEAESPSNASNAAPASPQSAGAAERDAARQLFEAKEVEYNPKRNFHITIGVLVAAGAGYGGYVWWQLQPKTAYSPAAVQSAAKSAPAAPLSAQVGQTAVPPPQAPPAGADNAQAPAAAPPGTPPAAAKSAAPPAAPAQTQAAGPKPTGPTFARSTAGAADPAAAARPSDRPAARAPGQRPAQGERSPITITPPALAVDPLVERGFESYQRGDLAGSRDAYRQALQREPLNRDALLGLAAIDVRARAFDAAEARYLKLLELDPRDVNAQAGLMALRGQVDPVQSESRLKTLIATSPDAAQLHFALGNQYAQQSRWAEAQAAYFKAYSGDSENADFVFNLAVSLDQLRQKALALQYYQRAIALAADRPVSFELPQIRIRIQEIQRQ
jgi:tetratricopeptide (TPR) repeat protein